MALSSARNKNQTSSASDRQSSYVGYNQRRKSRSGSNILVKLLLFIPNQVINFTCFMIRGRGRGIIGLAIFLWGLTISADAYWVAANPTAPALTNFGTPEGKAVLGLWTSLGLIFSSQRNAFLGAVATSTVIQVIEGIAVRGSTPQEAKGTLDHYSQFDAGSAPSNKINRAKAAHNDYLSAGMFQYYLVGFAAIGCWIADIVVTFQAHNPLSYWGDPLTVLAVAAVNIVKVFAAETGFAIMLRLNGRG
ncbi:MAG: hypothetical protein AAF063_00795 [Cyanobacteria bacterium J06643_5]